MSIPRWKLSETYTEEEEWLLKRLKRTRMLYGFLRREGNRIIDDAFQEELASMYRASGAGRVPVAPGLMAMATLLQGYQGVSDAEAVELSVVDMRWQMVLGRLGEKKPAFSQGALHDFRHRLIKWDMDRRLLERTVEVARETKGFDYKKLPKSLRVAVDSAPLEGAGRVEDTINLLGHAARNVVRCAADLLDMEEDDLCEQAGIKLLLASSMKRGLDRLWTKPGEREAALLELSREIESLQRWLEAHAKDETKKPELKSDLETLEKIVEQDTTPVRGDGGGRRMRKGVAPDRLISVEDKEMRHGRKSNSRKINGYQNHIAKELHDGLILACAVRPANVPEQEALVELNGDIEAQGGKIEELYVDRGYVSSPLVAALLDRGGEVVCRPWPQRNRHGLFTKEDFNVDLNAMTVTCPGGNTIRARLGGVVSFPARTCDRCPLRAQCTTAKCGKGRSIRIAEDEHLQQHLREQASSPTGRQRLRKRVSVEHSLAHVVQRQGRRARYRGVRNNLYDLRRACSIQNLETAQRMAA